MTTEIEPVRSNSPELAAMTLPKLKTVATQLGVDGAAKMKKDALVEAIADLQAKNREAAKAEREARREARNNRKKESKPSNNTQDSDDDGDDDSAPLITVIGQTMTVVEMIVTTVVVALIVTTVVVDVTVTAIATVTAHLAKSASQ